MFRSILCFGVFIILPGQMRCQELERRQLDASFPKSHVPVANADVPSEGSKKTVKESDDIFLIGEPLYFVKDEINTSEDQLPDVPSESSIEAMYYYYDDIVNRDIDYYYDHEHSLHATYFDDSLQKDIKPVQAVEVEEINNKILDELYWEGDNNYQYMDLETQSSMSEEDKEDKAYEDDDGDDDNGDDDNGDDDDGDDDDFNHWEEDEEDADDGGDDNTEGENLNSSESIIVVPQKGPSDQEDVVESDDYEFVRRLYYFQPSASSLHIMGQSFVQVVERTLYELTENVMVMMRWGSFAPAPSVDTATASRRFLRGSSTMLEDNNDLVREIIFDDDIPITSSNGNVPRISIVSKEVIEINDDINQADGILMHPARYKVEMPLTSFFSIMLAVFLEGCLILALLNHLYEFCTITRSAHDAKFDRMCQRRATDEREEHIYNLLPSSIN
jgi:hypothetical protein